VSRASAILVAVCVLGGCGGTSDETDDPAATTELTVFFVRDEKLDAAARQVDGPSAAIRALLAGPSADERAAGIATAIPEETTLRDLSIAGDLATADLSGSFDDGGGSLSMQLRVAQVVYTLTEFPTVARVRFRVAGTPVAAIGGEGVVVDPPVDREDFSGFE
jgi:spore germination protein GerM